MRSTRTSVSQNVSAVANGFEYLGAHDVNPPLPAVVSATSFEDELGGGVLYTRSALGMVLSLLGVKAEGEVTASPRLAFGISHIHGAVN
jgi:hypothetical protein